MISPYSSLLILSSWKGNIGYCFLLCLKNPGFDSNFTSKSCFPFPPPTSISSSDSELISAVTLKIDTVVHNMKYLSYNNN